MARVSQCVRGTAVVLGSGAEEGGGNMVRYDEVNGVRM